MEEEEEEEEEPHEFLHPIPKKFEPALIDAWGNMDTFILEPTRKEEEESKIGRIYFPRVCPSFFVRVFLSEFFFPSFFLAL